MIRKLVFVGLCVGLLFSPAVVGESLEDYLGEGTGYWIIEEEVDPLMDTVDLIFLLFCTESIESMKRGHFHEFKGIVLRLLDGEIDFFVGWDSFLGENNEILYRFDDGEVIESYWELGDAREELFFPAPREDLKDFVKQLLISQEFILGVTPAGERRETAIFDVQGLAHALLPYLGVLGWEELEETILEIKAPFNLSLYREDLENPQRLLEDPYVQATLEELLKDDYHGFLESMHSITIPMEYAKHDGTITMHGGVPGLYTIMEAKLQVHESGAIHAAFLEDFRIIYYTTHMEQLMEREAPNLLGWGHDFPTYPLVFRSATPPESSASLAGYYEHRDLQGAFTIEVLGDEVEYEGSASFGANIGHVGDLSTLYDANAPYLIYSLDYGYEEAIMQLTFMEGMLFVLERQGSFGGLNVTFNGWYEKIE